MKAAQETVETVESVGLVKGQTAPSYKSLGKFEGVLVKIPSINDDHMRWIQAHNFNGHYVPKHYRRGDMINGKLLVTRNFYSIEAEEKTGYLVADIEIFRKTNENGNSILIDIRPSSLKEAAYQLKIGSPKGQFKVPGTDRYVSVEER